MWGWWPTHHRAAIVEPGGQLGLGRMLNPKTHDKNLV